MSANNINQNLTIKSCGKRHSHCKECMPEVSQKMKSTKMALSDCGGCGRCDKCLGIVQEEGFKICRGCNQKLSIENFSSRADTKSTYRNKCRECYEGYVAIFLCEICKIIKKSKDENNNRICSKCKENLTR